MTIEQYTILEDALAERDYGSKYYGLGYTIENSDFYWCKGIGKETNPYEEDRSLYQILFHVFDHRRYGADYYLPENAFGVMIEIAVSRQVDEYSKTMVFTYDGKKSVTEIEKMAEDFYALVARNYPINEL